MKFLFILPRKRDIVPKGYEIICDNYKKELIRLRHTVKIISPDNAKDDRNRFYFFDKLLDFFKYIFRGCFSIDVLRFSNSSFEIYIQKLKIKENFDAIVLFQLRSALFEIKRLTNKKRTSLTFLFSVDAIPGNALSDSNDYKYFLFGIFEKWSQRFFEKRIINNLNSIHLISHNDVIKYKKVFPQNKIQKLGYSSNINYDELKAEKEIYDILFVGNLSYLPNIKMVKHFAEKIFPNHLNNYSIVIAGANPTRLIKNICSQYNFKLIANFPSTCKIIMQSKVVMCPSHDLSGIQTKILDAMKCSKPVVCYEQSNLGIGAESWRHIVVSSDELNFAENIEILLSNPILSKKVGQSGYKFGETHFNTSKSVKDFLKLC